MENKVTEVLEENTAGGIVKWCTLENSLAVTQIIKHRVTTRPRNSTSSYIPKRNRNMSI